MLKSSLFQIDRVQRALEVGSISTCLEYVQNDPLTNDEVLQHFKKSISDRSPTSKQTLQPKTDFALKDIASFLKLGKRPSQLEQKSIEEGLTTSARAVLSAEAKKLLPSVVLFEPCREELIFNQLRDLFWKESIGFLYHVNKDHPERPGHTSIRIGTIIFEFFHGETSPQYLEQTDALSAFNNSYWATKLAYDFSIFADENTIHRLQNAFLDAPSVKFDYLSRNGHYTCVLFITQTISQVWPELNIKPAYDPMFFFSSLLWLNPRMNCVTIHSWNGNPSLSQNKFSLSGVSPGLYFPEEGEHPIIKRIGHLAQTKPAGWKINDEW